MASYDWYGDTDPKAFEVFIDLHRKMPPGDRFAAAFDMIDMIAGFVEANVRRTYPNASDREVFLHVASRRLDRETMIRVYGWNPEAHRGGAVG